jgi:hypothetical protein
VPYLEIGFRDYLILKVPVPTDEAQAYLKVRLKKKMQCRNEALRLINHQSNKQLINYQSNKLPYQLIKTYLKARIGVVEDHLHGAHEALSDAVVAVGETAGEVEEFTKPL